MPDYKFTGDFPRVMSGLRQGVNALVSGMYAFPYGSTVVCLPGDTIHTDDPYPHAELAEVDGEPATTADPPVTVADLATLLEPEGATPADPAPTTEQEPTA